MCSLSPKQIEWKSKAMDTGIGTKQSPLTLILSRRCLLVVNVVATMHSDSYFKQSIIAIVIQIFSHFGIRLCDVKASHCLSPFWKRTQFESNVLTVQNPDGCEKQREKWEETSGMGETPRWWYSGEVTRVKEETGVLASDWSIKDSPFTLFPNGHKIFNHEVCFRSSSGRCKVLRKIYYI